MCRGSHGGGDLSQVWRTLGFGLVKEEGKDVSGGKKPVNGNHEAKPQGVFGGWQVGGIGWSAPWEVGVMRLEAGRDVRSQSQQSLVVTILRAFNFFP